jgi:hypothetical protein
MHQLISFAVVFAIAVALNLRSAAIAASNGNWGEGLGNLVFAPLVFFYGVYTILFFAVRLLRGKDAVAAYSASRLNYIAAGITLLGVLGAAANRI